MSPAYRAIRNERYPEYWSVEKRSVFGRWKYVSGNLTKEQAEQMLDLLTHPEILYPTDVAPNDNQTGAYFHG